MIRRPDAEDLSGNAAIEAVREAGEALETATRPLREQVGQEARGFYWTHVIPIAAIPALWLASDEWPDVFGTFYAYAAMIAAWGWFMWKGWLGPREKARVATRKTLYDDFDEACEMRAALEAEWTARETTR